MPTYSCVLFNPDGTGGAVVHSSKPIKACEVCVSKVSGYLCDFPVGPPVLDSNASRDVGGPVYQPPTCDKPLCDDCHVPQEKGVDYCPPHATGEDEITKAVRTGHVSNEKGQAFLI